MDQAGVLLDGAQVGHGDGAGGADLADVVADQVDDHDVLGVVLLQQVRLGPAGALDRPGLDGPSVPAEEQLGRGGGDLHAVPRKPNRSCVRRRVAAGQQGGEGVHVGVRGYRRGQDAAEVRLVDLARRDVVADAAHARRVRGAVEGRRPVAGRRPCQAPGAGGGTGSVRTSRKRAQVRRPSKSAATAQKPEESRAAGSSVTSARPVATRSPKRARGGRSCTPRVYGGGARVTWPRP